MLQNIPIILLVAIVLPLTLVKAQGYPVNHKPNCGVNEQYYSECKPCPKYCGNERVACTMMCKPGCGCKPGYVRQTSSSTACIPEAKCIKCGELEVYDECRAHCDDTCDGPTPCTFICKPGCKCKENYVRHRGRCIMRSRCPRSNN
ncbi:serine protease inhibitor swm-1-like isoform X2 [Bombina bombina]|uniref:serine protease inhibitor swm-1-like isoform X2 n=1 Tax=Bombina bombina TaxID=8345 RepID=UPI00235AEC2B|nr:serine protease inhibitor swm-1-like isoform X2 [Bombina bombina]